VIDEATSVRERRTCRCIDAWKPVVEPRRRTRERSSPKSEWHRAAPPALQLRFPPWPRTRAVRQLTQGIRRPPKAAAAGSSPHRRRRRQRFGAGTYSWPSRVLHKLDKQSDIDGLDGFARRNCELRSVGATESHVARTRLSPIDTLRARHRLHVVDTSVRRGILAHLRHALVGCGHCRTVVSPVVSINRATVARCRSRRGRRARPTSRAGCARRRPA